MIGTALPSSSSTLAPSASLYFVPSLKMWPTSTVFFTCERRLAERAGLARLHLAEVEPRARRRCRAPRPRRARGSRRWLAPVVRLRRPASAGSARIRRPRTPTAPRLPAPAPSAARISSARAGAQLARACAVGELLHGELVVAAQQHEHELAVERVDERLDLALGGRAAREARRGPRSCARPASRTPRARRGPARPRPPAAPTSPSRRSRRSRRPRTRRSSPRPRRSRP